MRITRLLSGLAVLLFVASMTARSQAQYYPRPNEPTGLYQPLIDPERFDPDYQFFATVDYDPFHGTREYNTGFFGGYDRYYIWMSRPETEPSRVQGDFTWGNRYEVGYMTPDNHGWLIRHSHIRGPNANHMLRIERLNRVNEDDFVGQPPPPDPTDDDPFDQDDLVFPVADRNNHFFDNELPPDFPLAREYILQNTLNVANYSSVEVNKTFRLRPYHNGAVLEPFFGGRYVKFTDYDIFDDYFGPFDTDFGTPAEPVEVVAETLIRDLNVIENHMWGGQIGFRYFHNLQRWQWSNEVRFFAMQNFQHISSVTTFVTTGYDGIGADEDVVAERKQELLFFGHNAAFVFGIDVRAAAAYQITRDFGLRLGFEYLHFGRGIWRGADPRFNDQQLIMAGITMGFEINR